MRPLGPAAILDAGCELFRLRARRLVGLAACLFIPIRILDLLFVIASGESGERLHIGPQVMQLGDASGWSWLVVALHSGALSVLGLAVGRLVVRMADGGDASFRELLALAARRSWVALLIVPIALLVRAPLSCIPLGFVFGDALLFVASVVAGSEGLGPWRSVRRSISLTRQSLGRMVGVSLGGLVLSQLLRLSFYTGPMVLAASFGANDAVLTVIAQAGALVVLVAEPLTACIAARAYLDLRCRHEGADLRRRVHQRFEVTGVVA